MEKHVDWSKPIQAIGFDPEDMMVSAKEISEEKGYVCIEVLYSAHAGGFSSADFWDLYCVDYYTGEPLNLFLPNDFSIENQ